MEVWKPNLIKLKKFKSKFGHANVPTQWKDPVLSLWVENIRKKKNQLPKALKAELVNLNFDFDYKIINDWDAMYLMLEEFYRKHGHTELPYGDKDFDLLRQWIENQRQSRKRLSRQNIKKLDELDFRWKPGRTTLVSSWLRSFEELKSYGEKHNTLQVPWNDPKVLDIYDWKRRQIYLYKRKKLSKDKIKLLDSIGFDWDDGREKTAAKLWMKNYDDLKNFYTKHGHCRIPSPSQQKSYTKLYQWTVINRAKGNKLSKDQREKLNDLGFLWSDDIRNKKNEKWELMYEKLKRFHKKNGHVRVTLRADAKLYRWLTAIEERVSIPKERRRKLEALGMVWKKERKKTRELHWNEMYQKLKKFYQQNDHLIVPIKNKELYNWVKNLREWGKTLTKEQRKKLKELNFDFDWKREDYFNVQWWKKYEELKKFKKQFGHCFPSKKSTEYSSLNLWIRGLRKNKNTLSTEQLRALDQLGLSLEKNAYFKSKWEHRYEELKSFKKQFGHMVVPKDTGDYIQLGSWVSVQRQYKHKLSAEQIKKLNQLGFSWGRKK